MIITEYTDLDQLGVIRDRAAAHAEYGLGGTATACAEDVPILLAALDVVLRKHDLSGWSRRKVACAKHGWFQKKCPDCKTVEYVACLSCKDEDGNPARAEDCAYRREMSDAIEAAKRA
jgi:hypothetical protein